MERRDTISILGEILSVLKEHQELSFNQLQKKTKSQWRTLIRCIEFLKKTDLIQEKKKDSKPLPIRLFSLK